VVAGDSTFWSLPAANVEIGADRGERSTFSFVEKENVERDGFPARRSTFAGVASQHGGPTPPPPHQPQ
jgi:hypothetical protein